MKEATLVLTSGDEISCEVELDSGGVVVKVSGHLELPKTLRSIAGKDGYLWLPAHQVTAVFWPEQGSSSKLGFSR